MPNLNSLQFDTTGLTLREEEEARRTWLTGTGDAVSTYLGAITLPFRDFSFVVKAQCPEYGMTGLRDAVLLDGALASGRIRQDDMRTGGAISGWMRDPYDPAIEGPMLRNLAEDEEYDVRFPDHPLSRCRALLSRCGIR